MRPNDAVRGVVLTAPARRRSARASTGRDRRRRRGAFDPFIYEDPGKKLGPKSNDLWKPVIAAVKGMACGGAFYMLGEVEFIIAAEPATFFDPHVTYGMTAVYEPMLMIQRMPFGEIARLTLMGDHERMSARRAYEIGLVSEVVLPRSAGGGRGRRGRDRVAAGARRAGDGARDVASARLAPAQADALGPELLNSGLTKEALEEGQQAFHVGQAHRMEAALKGEATT